jgi:hypothetical protein
MRKYRNARIVDGIALATPAARMVVVEAGTDWHQIYPVLAIQAANEHHIYRRADDYESIDVPPTIDQVDESGWLHQTTGVDYDLIILDAEFGVTSARFALDADNVAWDVFLAPWSPAEDEDRLAVHVERLKREAAAKVAKEREARAAKAT